MELIADGLLILAALVASLYCIVLSRRLRRLNQLDAGLGGAIAALSGQVDEMRGALNEAKMVTERSKRELDDRTKRAEAAAGRLELLLAAVQDGKSPPFPPESSAAGQIREVTKPASPEPDSMDLAQSDVDITPTMSVPDFDDLPDAESDQPTDTDDPAFDDTARSARMQSEEGAARAREDEADIELKLAEAVSNPDLLTSEATTGISKELLSALEKMAGGRK